MAKTVQNTVVELQVVSVNISARLQHLRPAQWRHTYYTLIMGKSQDKKRAKKKRQSYSFELPFAVFFFLQARKIGGRRHEQLTTNQHISKLTHKHWTFDMSYK